MTKLVQKNILPKYKIILKHVKIDWLSPAKFGQFCRQAPFSINKKTLYTCKLLKTRKLTALFLYLYIY